MLLAPGRRWNIKRRAVFCYRTPRNIDLEALFEHFADTLIAEGGSGIFLRDEFLDQCLDALGANLASIVKLKAAVKEKLQFKDAVRRCHILIGGYAAYR